MRVVSFALGLVMPMLIATAVPVLPAHAQFLEILSSQQEETAQEQDELLRLKNKETPEKYFHENRPDYDQALYAAAIAIHAGKTLTASELGAVKGKVNERVNDKMTLFFYAAYQRNLNAMGQLLDIGADPLMKLRSSYSPSFAEEVAAGSKKLATDMLAVLLDHGLNPGTRLGSHGAPLVVKVAEHGNLDSFKLLIERGADPWAEQEEARPIRHSAMTQAADASEYEILAYAVDKGFFKDADPKRISEVIKSIDKIWLRDDSISRAVVAITRRITEETRYPGDEHSRYILDFGEKYFGGETLNLTFTMEGDARPPVDEGLNSLTGKIILGKEIMQTDIDAIKPKINRWVEPDKTLLAVAMHYDCNLKTIDLLLANGADGTIGYANSFAETAVLNGLSGYCPHGALLGLYLKNGGDPNGRILQWGMPLVARAAQFVQYDSVERLVDAGADPWARARGRFERSAMEQLINYASHDLAAGNLEMIDRLADKGVFRNAPAEPFAAFMAEIEIRCPYYTRMGRMFKSTLRKIVSQSGYKTSNACIASP